MISVLLYFRPLKYLQACTCNRLCGIYKLPAVVTGPLYAISRLGQNCNVHLGSCKLFCYKINYNPMFFYLLPSSYSDEQPHHYQYVLNEVFLNLRMDVIVSTEVNCIFI